MKAHYLKKKKKILEEVDQRGLNILAAPSGQWGEGVPCKTGLWKCFTSHSMGDFKHNPFEPIPQGGKKKAFLKELLE